MYRVSLVPNHEKLERFVAEFSERGFQFACGLCGNEEEAKELTQEAFCRVFRSWEQYDSSQPLDTWFLTILRHLYVDSTKRYERRFSVSMDASLVRDGDDGEKFSDHMSDAREESVLDRLSREEMAREVRRALASLSPDHKAVLTLCDVEGLNYDQIAEVIGCPVGTVRSRINRAREILKRKLLETSQEVDVHGM